MLRLGYTLSSEEHDPKSLVRFAQIAEAVGFSFLGISDHFHPWVDTQGQSAFVWSTIGALSQVLNTASVFVEVTCPIIRYHPAIIAQAAATSQVMLEGRFIMGVGTGENLNEHVVGKFWPPIQVRQEMLAEAVEIMRLLWQGGYQSFFGKFFNVDAARIYTLPENSIPIIVSAMGPKSAELAGRLGDGLVTTMAEEKMIQKFQNLGGKNKPMFIQVNICYDPDSEKAKQLVKTFWPNAGLPKPLNSELRLPQDFQNAAQLVQPDMLSQKILIGADSEAVIKKIQEYQKVGFDHIYLHNIGPNQQGFLTWAENKILPAFRQQTPLKQAAFDSPVAYAHQVKK